MKISCTALLIAILLPIASNAEVSETKTEVVADAVRALRADRSVTATDKVARFTEMAAQPDISKNAQDIATAARIRELIRAKLPDQARAEADAFISSRPENQHQLYFVAKLRLLLTPSDEKIAYVKSISEQARDDLALRLRSLAEIQVADALAESDPAAAFDFLLGAPSWFEWTGDSELPISTVVSKLAVFAAAARRSDALQWAYANYALCEIAEINRAIDIVTRAFRSIDGNIGRANAFIDYQRTGEGEDPLKGTEMPSALMSLVSKIDLTKAAIPNRIQMLIAKGEFAEALDQAKTDYVTASRASLSRSVGQIASVLKARDGNVLRANAYIQSQKDQKPFDLTIE